MLLKWVKLGENLGTLEALAFVWLPNFIEQFMFKIMIAI